MHLTSLIVRRTVFDHARELIVELQFGEGGQDSKLFVADLASVYIKHANSLGFKSEVLNSDFGHQLLKFIGKGVWQAFKHEPGKHVVQRVPPTERSGRRQTSIVSVAVLPLPPEDKMEPLKEKDLETICQTGKQKAGGQNVNKVASAVRMKHKPTGLSVFVNGRDQGQNKKEALKILTARVNQVKREKEESAYFQNRKQQIGGGNRGDKVRTYNFLRGDVTDHNLNVQTNNIKEIMKGNLRLLFALA